MEKNFPCELFWALLKEMNDVHVMQQGFMVTKVKAWLKSTSNNCLVLAIMALSLKQV